MGTVCVTPAVSNVTSIPKVVALDTVGVVLGVGVGVGEVEVVGVGVGAELLIEGGVELVAVQALRRNAKSARRIRLCRLMVPRMSKIPHTGPIGRSSTGL